MLGNLGEKIVRHLAQEEGCVVKENPSLYDNTKDLTINGKSCEVKTQTRFVVERAFSVKENQVTKCNNVDLLYFVETPIEGDIINIYECPKENRNFRTRPTKDGRLMYLLDIDAMNVIYSLKDQWVANEMRQNSNSTW